MSTKESLEENLTKLLNEPRKTLASGAKRVGRSVQSFGRRVEKGINVANNATTGRKSGGQGPVQSL